MASFLSRILSWFRSIGNRTLCCPILSIIILVINKSDSDSVNYSYDYRPNWTPLGPITIINQHTFWCVFASNPLYIHRKELMKTEVFESRFQKWSHLKKQRFSNAPFLVWISNNGGVILYFRAFLLLFLQEGEDVWKSRTCGHGVGKKTAGNLLTWLD